MVLQDHYDRKYSAEDGRVQVDTVRASRYPVGRIQACVSLLPRAFQGGRLLEVGAGSGVIARSLIAEGVHFDELVLTDISEVRLRGLAASFSDPRVSTEILDADEPEPGLGQFDAIVMVALIEHLVDPLRSMQRFRSLVAPGGFVWIDTPNVAKWTRRVKLAAGRFPSTASKDEGLLTYDGRAVDLYDEGHLHYFTFRSLERLLTERCGFSRCVRAPYWVDGGPAVLGTMLARMRPTLFSDTAVLAFA